VTRAHTAPSPGFRSNWVDATITTSVTKTERDPPVSGRLYKTAARVAHSLTVGLIYTSWHRMVW
jgi:hypothetical protein